MKSLFLSILSGVLLFLSYPTYNLYPLLWFAFVPLLIATAGKKPGKVFLYGMITGTIAITGGFYWIANVGGIALKTQAPYSYIFSLLYALAIAPMFGGIFVLFRSLRNNTKIDELLLFPVIVVAFFSFYPMLFYFKLGDGQTLFLPALQAIEFTGVYGLDFTIALANVFLYRLLAAPRKALNHKPSWLAVVWLLLWFGYGTFSLADWDNKIDQWVDTRIGIVQPNRQATLQRMKPEPGYSYEFPMEMEMTQKLVEQKVDLVIWPEGNFFGYDYWPSVYKSFKTLIGSMATPVILLDSTREIIDGKKHYYNTSILIDEDGIKENYYHKMRLVPFGEYTPIVGEIAFLTRLFNDFITDLSSGKKHEVFSVKSMKLVPKICYETLFPELVADSIGENSAGKIILAQSQDGWYGETSGPVQHLVSSGLRAIENRVSIIHVINNGPSGIILPNGRQAFFSPAFTKGEWVANMPFDPESGGSFYSKYPRLFIRSVQFLFFLFLILRIYNHYQTKNKNKEVVHGTAENP